jgi:hypothetical protein
MRELLIIGAAEEEHQRGVSEPPGNGWERIDEYIRGESGLVWNWIRKRYKRNRQFEWCGAFSAHCYAVAGLPVRLRRKHMASCYRLYKWSKGNARRIAPADIQAGDIVVVGPEPAPRTASRKLRKERPRWGRHICVAVGPAGQRARRIETIEGNAKGVLGDGTHGEGVVRRHRPLVVDDESTYRVLYGIRPLDDDWGT